jgi:phosphoribosylanthranilate isomerase
MKQVKICGLSREEDISYVNMYQPQYIGFVFAPSKRQITLEQAITLKKLLSPNILAVGVFVNEDIEKVVEIVESGCIDLIQLHGQEDKTYIQTIKDRCDTKLIKAINVVTKEDVKDIDYDVDYYLLDGASSGSGQVFDWKDIKEVNKPYFLAGGISLENIGEALQVSSYGIDISSGVETNGTKDKEKVKEIVRRVQDESR